MIIRINKEVFKRKLKFFFVVLIALMIGFMFHVDRSMNMDFNRFQEIMDNVRYSQVSFTDFMADNSHLLKWLNVTLPFMYSFNTLVFWVSRLFENNYVIVWISVVIDYSIIAYIAYDWRSCFRYTRKEIITSIIICYAFLPMIHVCSGLRTATSACFMALAIYKFLYQGKSLLTFGVLIFISVTFHPFTLFALPIALVIRLSDKKIIFYITFFGCLFISRIATFFLNSGNVFLRALATKYVTYTDEGQFRAYRFAMYGVIVFSLIAIGYYFFIFRREDGFQSRIINSNKSGRYQTNNENKLYLFLISYMALLIGNVGSYEMVCRGGYIIGAAAPIMMSLFFRKNNGVNTVFAVMARIIMIILVMYMCISWTMYYYPYFISV